MGECSIGLLWVRAEAVAGSGTTTVLAVVAVIVSALL